MKKAINPKETSRAAAFELWMSSPMPMVTLTKTFDVSRLVKKCKKKGWKFNMLLCWTIGCAASRMKEFYFLPEKIVNGQNIKEGKEKEGNKKEGKENNENEKENNEKENENNEKEGGNKSWALMQYDSLAINVIVNNAKGGINSCDIPYTDDISQFNDDYLRLTAAASSQCQSSFVEDAMVVGTSAMIEAELDSIVNQYSDLFCNPMVMWGRYRRGFWRTTLPISFQFHHVQMDGGHAARFLELLQAIINLQ